MLYIKNFDNYYSCHHINLFILQRVAAVHQKFYSFMLFLSENVAYVFARMDEIQRAKSALNIQ